MRQRSLAIIGLFALLFSCAWAQESKAQESKAKESKPAGILSAADLKTVVPTSFFYRGQSASTQLRNSGGIRTAGGKFVLAGLVDTAGYASDIAQKYQGFFITEVKVKAEGSELSPGEYGFGFVDGKFVITDAGANELLSVSSNNDEALKRATPLKITQDGNGYRLYAGKKYVTLEME